ncbi:MAG: hypothetical protein ACI8RN_002549 [Glaciecola sp.]
MREEFTLDELGFAQQAALFERECDRLGAVPPVLRRLTKMPEKSLWF